MKTLTNINSRFHSFVRCGFHIVIFTLAFIILVSRDPTRIFDAQFWAEDGTVFYASAYNLGFLNSLFLPYSGALCFAQRLIMGFVQLFPLAWAPLIANVLALSIQVLPVNLIISSRFALAIPSPWVRLLLAFLYLAMPNGFAVHANIATIHWHLALLACLVILAQPSKSIGWRLFDLGVVLLSALSGSFSILFILFAFLYWRLCPHRWLVVLISTSLLALLVQVYGLMLISIPARDTTNLGPTFDLFARILSGQVFVASLIGHGGYGTLVSLSGGYNPIAYVIGALGTIIVFYAFLQGPVELRFFIFYGTLTVSAALASATVSWKRLWLPGAITQYWLIPSLAFVASLVWLARQQQPYKLRIAAIVLLAVMSIGIFADWEYPPLVDLKFQEHAATFEQAPAGTEVIIPINPPGWFMKLVKH